MEYIKFITARLTEAAVHAPVYHVTDSRKVPAILRQGLKTGKPQTWSNRFGVKQGSRKHLYVFSSYDEAIRMAARAEYDSKQPQTVLHIGLVPDDLVPDPHWESQLQPGTWWMTTQEIAPELIVKAEPLTLQMKRDYIKRRDGLKESRFRTRPFTAKFVYHGMARDTAVLFRPGRVAYFTPNFKDALDFAFQEGSIDGDPPYVVKAQLNLKKTALLKTLVMQDLHDEMRYAGLVKELLAAGYDSAVPVTHDDEVVVLDSSVIHVVELIDAMKHVNKLPYWKKAYSEQ